MSNETTGKPTQVAHPWKAALRTLSALIAGLVLLGAVLGLFAEVFDPYLGDSVTAWLGSAATFLAVVVTFLTRLMALEAWQPFLERIGLGTGVEKERREDPPA